MRSNVAAFRQCSSPMDRMELREMVALKMRLTYGSRRRCGQQAFTINVAQHVYASEIYDTGTWRHEMVRSLRLRQDPNAVSPVIVHMYQSAGTFRGDQTTSLSSFDQVPDVCRAGDMLWSWLGRDGGHL